MVATSHTASPSPSPVADSAVDIKTETSAPTTEQQPAAPPKRKPSRRANTAERRATHNAVERARRETLNGRFLDLAALLPNLSQIRRPSKSAIVNSSIAHINASKRHRMMASRELRSLKQEADALRRELNEWRDRAALPRIEEPMRGEGFGMVLSGELEVISVSGITEEDEDGEEIEVTPAPAASPVSPPTTSPNEGGQFYHEAPAEPTAAAFAGHQGPPTPPASSHGVPMHGLPMQPRNLHPMVVNTQQVHFDPAHPSNMHGLPQLQQMPQHFGHMHAGYPHPSHHQEQLMQQEKAAWNMGYVAAHAQRSMQPQNSWDSSVSGHEFGGRARSASMSAFSSGSPPRSPGSSLGEYEMGAGPNANDYGVPRGLSVNTMGLGGMGGVTSSPISIVGGNGFGGGMAMGMM